MEGHKESTENSRSKLLDKSKMKLHIIHRLYTQEEADETESFYQLNFDCVNKKVTGRTDKEYNKSHKKQKAEYYQKNKEKISAQRTINNKKNKEKIKKQTAKYYQKNKEKIKSQATEYKEKNKEKIAAQRSEPYECECGSIIRKDSKSAHIKSKKHRDYISQK
tara:strand:- start:30 stop:518 length:489 start_codon:yes stop_codon:yes gene_type:complete